VSTVSTVKTNHVTFRILIVKVFVNNLFISWIVSMKSCFRALCKGPSAACPRTSVSMYCKTAVEAALVIISAMCYISGGRKDHHFHLDLPNFRLRAGDSPIAATTCCCCCCSCSCSCSCRDVLDWPFLSIYKWVLRVLATDLRQHNGVEIIYYYAFACVYL